MSGLGELNNEIRAEWSKLRSSWQSTRAQWQDEVADQFERNRWQVWEDRVPAFLKELEELEETASRALRET